MEFAEQIDCKQVDTLYSGRFYWIHTVSRCYRINEVDHFLKDLTTDLLVFLDNQGLCHHFNREESKSAAVTSLKEILAVPNLKTIACFEINQNTIDAFQKGNMEKSGERESSRMLKKIVSLFYDKQKSESGWEFSIEELKSSFMQEYIRSVELRH